MRNVSNLAQLPLFTPDNATLNALRPSRPPRGASIYDIHILDAFLDPLAPLCPQNLHCLSANLGYFLTPLSILFGRHIWKPLGRLRLSVNGGGVADRQTGESAAKQVQVPFPLSLSEERASERTKSAHYCTATWQ